jgi:hypothetical protein
MGTTQAQMFGWIFFLLKKINFKMTNQILFKKFVISRIWQHFPKKMNSIEIHIHMMNAKNCVLKFWQKFPSLKKMYSKKCINVFLKFDPILQFQKIEFFSKFLSILFEFAIKKWNVPILVNFVILKYCAKNPFLVNSFQIYN